ncbi:hypothetical protein ACQEVS_06630 [Streptomyces sp. CA-181903]|uniref:hypothetical protein n=1 Tax=Streptomyces sp. CA-181903 TaxID=3240055 RepID=UPI003D8A81A3
MAAQPAEAAEGRTAPTGRVARWADRWTGRRTGRWTSRWTDRRAGRRTGRWRRPEAGIWLLLTLALTLYWLPLRALGEVNLEGMGGLGLVSVLPVTTLVGAALLVVSFAAALLPVRPRTWLLAAVLLATVVSLHAVPAVLEDRPRFATAWQHLGFLDYIDRTGTAAPDLDARWSWPGFFALAAFAARACGVDDLTEVLRWWPLAVQLVSLAPLALLLRAVRAHWRAKWTALWLFALCGWVGQDYFSPQSLSYVFYLLFVAVLLVWFRWPGELPGRRLPGERRVEETDRRTRTVLLTVLIALFAAAVAGHQLTPFVMLGVLTALVLVRRCTLRGLPLLCGVMLAVWVGFLAEPYWSGHFDELFGGLGSLGGNVSSSVSGRIEGGNPVHKLVLYTRVALAGGVFALAALGWWRRRRSGVADTALAVLTCVPFLAFGMQSYGGEVALRVFLFAVPGACVLGALALFPTAGRTPRPLAAPLCALTAGLVLMFGFLVARWGNEDFERVRPGEVAAMDYVYAHDSPTVRLLWMSSDTVNNVTPAMPWGTRDMERVLYEPTLAPRDPSGGAPDLVKALRAAGPNSYLVLNHGQSTYLELSAGYTADWDHRMRRALDRSPELRRVLTNTDAALYELRDRPRGPHPTPPRPHRPPHHLDPRLPHRRLHGRRPAAPADGPGTDPGGDATGSTPSSVDAGLVLVRDATADGPAGGTGTTPGDDVVRPPRPRLSLRAGKFGESPGQQARPHSHVLVDRSPHGGSAGLLVLWEAHSLLRSEGAPGRPGFT